MTDGEWISVVGTICRGHGVASGLRTTVFPEGSIRLQHPHFLERGLDIGVFHPGTINVSIAPLRFALPNAEFTFRDVRWSPDHPPEDFSFSRCRVELGGVVEEGLVYYPHPETKPAHFQDLSVVEVLAPFMDGVDNGVKLTLHLRAAEVALSDG